MGASKSNRPSTIFQADYTRLVETLAGMRDQAGLTQEDLAKRLKRHRSFIWKTEGGQRRLDLIEFVKWCKACGADPVKIFTGWYR